MNRRTTLERITGGSIPFEDDLAASQDISPYANRVLPDVQRTTAGLEPYTGTWGVEQILHLLRRTTFGPARAHVSALRSQSINTAVDSLLSAPSEESSKPLNTDTRDLVSVGDTWVYSLYQDPNSTFNPSSIRATSLKAWWTGLLFDSKAVDP